MTPLLTSVLAWAAGCLLAAAGLRPVRRTIPCLGGMTLAAVTAGATVAATAAALGPPDRRVSAVLLAAAAVALLGLIADVGALPLATRLVVESVAAGGVVLCGVQVTLTGDWPDGPLSVMWIVAMTNAHALLDRLGGALAGVAAVTGAGLAAAALLLADPALAVPAAVLSGACLGFLPYGRGRGRVRLGPSAALFAGFGLTCLTVALAAGRGPAAMTAGMLVPALAVALGAGLYGVRPRRWAGGGRRGAAGGVLRDVRQGVRRA
ncbi:hypothetical protein [Microbispora triticiradicis]|uniref:Uncharacterized protein n=2 Tax=Microbispora TaxID=2005 RepID=A0ABY3LW63_9ACTN|nr:MULTISPECIES: hypothetical protein [Microbispora]TLP63843.1 hypothetical protein FED44_06275 [Microbispora fusca]TYB57513.1 hypothetical protein FXF59_18310 [Microbispora tritici]